MSRRILVMAVVWGLAATVSRAEEKPADSLETLVSKMHSLKVNYEGDINNVSLFDLLQSLSRKYDITFTINEKAFREYGEEMIRERKPAVTATRLDGLTLHRFLDFVLKSMNATVMVRKDYLEIVPISEASRESKAPLDDDGNTRTGNPLISLVVKEKALSEIFVDLADWYDASIVFAPQAVEAKALLVSARLQNVPLEKALQLLASHADLRIVPMANAYLITTAEHADQLGNQEIQREKQKADLDSARNGSFSGLGGILPPPAIPPAPPAKDDEPKKKKKSKNKKPNSSN